MEDSSSPTSSPSYHTAPQTQNQQLPPSSSSTLDQNDSTSSPAKSPFPRANLTPTTSLNGPSPPTPARASALQQLEKMNVSSSSQMLPPSSSQPQSQAGPSGTQIRRTAAEIQKNKENAQKRLREKQQEKLNRETLKVKQERAEARRELASKSLGEFGFSVSPMTRYGTGKGGTGTRATTPGYTAAQPEAKEEWKPDERCSEEQKEVLEQVKKGGNVFFTGSAGVGKSFLLHEVMRLLEHMERPFHITAPTGIAALQVNGSTTHSWASVGLGEKPIFEMYNKITGYESRKENWTKTKTLIIDEISMIPAALFDNLNILGKLIRENPAPFGGLQLIVCGDFYQLPPVVGNKTLPKCVRCGGTNLHKVSLEDARVPYEKRPEGIAEAPVYKCSDSKNGAFQGCLLESRRRVFAFETDAWAECQFHVMELTKVYRQSDPDFIRVLEKIRRGSCDQECVDLFKTCGNDLKKGGEIEIKPTNLYPKKAAVEIENDQEFRKLKTQEYFFTASDEARGDYAQTQLSRLDSTPASKLLKLKVGAQVLLLANLDVKGGLVNGSRGVIVDWVDASEVEPTIAEGTGPKKPGGSGRVGTEEWREKAADSFIESQEEQCFPQVIFANGREVIIRPHSWCIDFDRNNTVARTQIPLQLAWALTIHKSQGQSLDAVCVRLGQTFEKGQAYVALSRARTKGGLKVDGFKPGVVMAHPTVEIFYKCIAEKKPFFLSPVAPTNPLSFIPDYDPLNEKLKRKFGPAPPPLEKGSAILAPGQKKPQMSGSQSQSQSQSRPPPKNRRSEDSTWQELLKQASEKYVETTGSLNGSNTDSIPMEPFLAFAGSVLITALGKRGRREEGEESGSGEFTDASEGSPMAIDDESEGGDRKPKKKKKRVRKGRVGH
ncbi:hypothetical protein JCM3765_007464 [Sporobolomyces pararoseus]